MTTLITGGTGFIGAEIARMLIGDGQGPIHVAQRSPDLGRLSDLADHVELHHLDLADPEEIDAVVGAVRPSRVFHFGAILTGPGEQDPPTLLRANAIGFVHFIEAARRVGTEQFIFASSIGTYGRDLAAGQPIDDLALQRPSTVYGVTKVFGEHLGAYYRQRYGLDFRALRYPAIVGPGVTTWSLAQYTSWMIERPARGEPFSVWVEPESVIALLWHADAARAAVELASAPVESIRSISYLVDGPRPTPSAGELADAVRLRLPDAEISFDPAPDSPGTSPHHPRRPGRPRRVGLGTEVRRRCHDRRDHRHGDDRPRLTAARPGVMVRSGRPEAQQGDPVGPVVEHGLDRHAHFHIFFVDRADERGRHADADVELDDGLDLRGLVGEGGMDRLAGHGERVHGAGAADLGPGSAHGPDNRGSAAGDTRPRSRSGHNGG